MTVLEITIQRKAGDAWPVVLEHSRPDSLSPIRKEGELRLGDTDLDRLVQLEIEPLAYGEVLGQALFSGPAREAFLQARARDSGDLRVLLFVEDKELQRLYWGRLCAPTDDCGWDFMALDQRAAFSLYLPSATDRTYRPIGQRDLRALLLIANPNGLTSYGLHDFDATATMASLRQTLGQIPIPCEVLAAVPGADGPPTLDELCRRLTDGRHTLLHVVAHGKVERDETYLFLAGGQNQVERVAGEELIRELRRIDQLPHFIFLATCHSAQPKAGLGGLAQRLVDRLGAPAVVAMTEAVSIETAEALGAAFYEQLRANGKLDVALVKACSGLTRRHDVTVPALYSRLGGRPLFSDTLSRELNAAEIAFGLDRLEALLPERAPVLAPDLAQHIIRLRAMLGARRGNLSEAARREWDEALGAVNRACEEVLDLNFNALALGNEAPRYDSRCPFRGLLAFGYDDREFFKGREELVAEMVIRLDAHPFLAVLGGSGSGKSSLVLAGLVPALEARHPGLQMAYMTPGDDPVARLDAALGAQHPAGQPASASSSPPAEVASPQSLLVVDQFEELFTLTQDDEKRQAFIRRLLELAERQFIVLTMRADFWGDCAPYAALRDAMLAHQVLIAPLNTAELRSAMEQQAATVGLRFEADLSNTILDAVRDEPGAMPLLQHLLLELWKRRHGRWLLTKEYRDLGGVQRAITQTAEAFYGGLTSGEQDRVRDIFQRLTRLDDKSIMGGTWRDTRHRVDIDELLPARSDAGATTKLVQRLADVRLVVTSEGKVEVAHEALIQYWPRLREWLDQDRSNLWLRERIRQAAVEWEENNRGDSYLVHRGRRLEQAKALASQPKFALSEREQAYLDACIALQERTSLVEAKIRVFNRTETGYPVELSVPGWGEAPRGMLSLDQNLLSQYLGDDIAYGRALGEALFGDRAFSDAYQNLMSAVRRQGGKLQVRLQLDPAELSAIPWERTYHPVDGNWYPLALTSSTLFCRDVAVHTWQRPQPITERPIRILAVIASPSNLEEFNENRLTGQALHATLDRLPGLEVTYLETGSLMSPTLDRIQGALADGYHMVHFYCHSAGQPSLVAGGLRLELEKDDGALDLVGYEQFVSIFKNLSAPPLFCYVAASHTATLGLELLKDTGIQVVVAMSGAPSLVTADGFAEQFYTSLFIHGMVDRAVNEARVVVQHNTDWHEPTLLSKLPNNKLIDFSKHEPTAKGAPRQEVEAEIRVFAPDELGAYPVELSVPGWREFLRGKLLLDLPMLSTLKSDPQTYGQKLGEALFADKAMGDAYEETVVWARKHSDKLCLRLRLDSPELHELYWERVYQLQDGAWSPLTISPLTPFSRYIPVARWEQPSPVTDRPLRVLAIVASPFNLEEYRLHAIAREEIQMLHTTLGGLPNVEVTYLETGTANPPTLNQIQKALMEGYHLIHFLCHSRRSLSSGESALFLEGHYGKSAILKSDRLVRIFASMPTPPLLCFLDARDEGSASVGMALVAYGGVRTAVAMTNRIAMETAQRFVYCFYTQLLNHGMVDQAVNQARAVVLGELDAATPILFSGVTDNRLIGF